METLEERAPGGKHQTLLCQGPVDLRRGWRRKKQHLSLFSDVLVVSNSLRKRKFKIKYVIPLSYLWMSDNVDTVGTDSRAACKSILLSWPAGTFVATFGSTDQKDRWYYFLQRSINEATKGHRKYLNVPIFTEDIPDCASPLYVTTTDLETVNDVIKELLPMIGMPSAQNYQLWFCHSHKEAPSLLQEHEHPYDIIMRNLQNTSNGRESRSRTAFPALPGLYVEQPAIQGRFILKPRDAARSQKQSYAGEATVNRRSLASWLFRRGSVPRQDQVCPAPPVAKTGKLFGNDLTAICEDGNLPTGILDVLSFVSEKGPVTEGIFRTSGDVRAFRALKERLDSGTEVTLTNESVPVVASILKDFLQNIPGSVLTSRLYDDWLSILDQECDERKVAAIQSLLEQLPQPNGILLKQLFGILYKIMKNSEVNHMTSSNLAICTALSILCLPSSGNSVLADVTKKTSLVNFLIEKYPTIFGEDLSLPEESSLPCSDGEEAYSSPITPGHKVEVEEKEDADDPCPSEGTSPTDSDALPQRPADALHNEGTSDSEKQIDKSDDDRGSVISQDNVCLNPPAPKEDHLPANSQIQAAPME